MIKEGGREAGVVVGKDTLKIDGDGMERERGWRAYGRVRDDGTYRGPRDGEDEKEGQLGDPSDRKG